MDGMLLPAASTPTLKWTKPSISTPLPPVRGGHGLVSAGLQLVLFGGHAYLGGGKFEYLNDTWVLDVQELTWQRVYPGGVPPEPRYGASCSIVGSRMFVFGGRGANGTLFRDVHFLDLVDWTWVNVSATSAGPGPRFNHASLVVGRKIVVHGGWNGAGKCFGDMHVFDTETFTWVAPKTGGLKPPPMYGHSLNLSASGQILCVARSEARSEASASP
jgi:host cell factor